MTSIDGPDDAPPAPPATNEPSPAAATGRGLAAACVGAFLFGLDMGWLSTGALFAGVAWQLLRPGRPAGLLRAGLGPVLLLLLTLVSYYGITVGHGQYDPARAVAYLAICLLGYLAGLTAAGPHDGEALPDALILFAFAALGSATYAALSASQGVQTGEDLLIRFVPSFWSPDDLVAATALGAYAVPGVTLLAAALFAVREERPLPWRLILVAASATGAAASALLLNRSPFLALAVAALACGWLWLTATEVDAGQRFRRLALLAVGVVAAAAAARSLLGVADVSILARFDEEGLSTGRYQVWGEVLSQLFAFPLGGRAFPISENFAHNLWLDVGYDAGPAPFLLLLAFHAAHAPAALAVVRRHPSLNTRLVTVAALAAFGLTAMAEPVLVMSVPHFALGLLLLGGLRRTAAALAAREDAASPASEAAPPAPAAP